MPENHMNTSLAAALIMACLFAAILIGRVLRRLLPEPHLSADTKDSVKLAVGLVATMAALLLGLLVSSAKGSYDTERNQVIQMAAKVTFLDRVLTLYGPGRRNTRPASCLGGGCHPARVARKNRSAGAVGAQSPGG
jgi:hypothetical protein